MINLRIINANVYTPIGNKAAKGAEMRNIQHIPDAEIDIEGEKIVYVGPRRAERPEAQSTIDAAGRAVLPGFVDSHTHLIFGGYRADEFGWRMRGDTYMSIMERGGGIASTVDATRAATHDQLAEKARKYLTRMSQMGITTVEAKSGYGLDHDCEIKQLEVIKELATDPERGVDVVATYLGAHAMPPRATLSNDEYIDWIIAEMLPVVKERQLADFCDIFCEKGVFTVEQSRRLLSAAKQMGFGVKIHADEIVCTHGAELAAELGALSADHLLHASDQGIQAMAEAGTVATLLPLTAFALREPYARGRQMIDDGCAVALATDLNPGSCHSGSIPLTFALACIYMGMSVEEALTAITLNGAAAIGRADTIGTLEAGKQADMVILDAPSPAHLPYYTGMNSVATTIARGRITAINA